VKSDAMLNRLKILALLLVGMPVLAGAGQGLLLQDSQVQALGIETQQIAQAQARVAQRLAARVSVPLAQLRLLAAPAEGLIEMLAVSPGDSVKRGQVLAHLRSAKVLELQAAELTTASQAALEQENLRRDELLFAEGLIAEARLKATRNAARQASTLANERRLGLAMAGITPGKMGSVLALTAPIDGTILEQTAQLGERVEAAATIYRIGKLSPLWLEIQAPLDVATSLKIGDPVSVLAPALSGRLIAIGRSVDPASQTVLLRAAVREGAAQLTPGQVLEVDLAAAQTVGVKLPASAVVRVGKDAVVFVQAVSAEANAEKNGNPARQYEVRPVKLLGQGGQDVSLSGVQPGEAVVIKGASSLKGMLQSQGGE